MNASLDYLQTLNTPLGPVGRVWVFNGFHFIDGKWFIKLDDETIDVSLYDRDINICDTESGAPICIGSTDATTHEGNTMVYGWFDKHIGTDAQVTFGGKPFYNPESINLVICE